MGQIPLCFRMVVDGKGELLMGVHVDDLVIAELSLIHI